jgi:phosphopantetheinyl transferase (holo-ACP synthase)
MSRARVGNDVVDLDDPTLRGKPAHARFLERVLAPSERETVSGAEDPHLALWTCWAAKEAAYKVVTKLRGEPPVFVHRAFVATDEAVEYEELTIPIHVRRDGPALHVVAAVGADPSGVLAATSRVLAPGAPWDGASLEDLLPRFTAREVDAVHSLPSAAVRLGARAALAGALAVMEHRLEIVCAPGYTGRRPPAVLLDGESGPADVSLSHHGKWIAWAIAV